MEGVFGRELGAVRVHERAPIVRSLGARAMTAGRDIFFAPGDYAPHTPAGRARLVHELVHVLQHDGASSRAERVISRRDGHAEREAERIAADDVRAEPVDVTAVPRAAIHRQHTAGAHPDQDLCNALALIGWIDRAGPFTRAELFADAEAMALLDPRPALEEDLQPLLDLLVSWGVVHAPSAGDPRYLRAFALDDVQHPQFGTARSLAPIGANRCFNPQREMRRRGLAIPSELAPRAWWATTGHEALLASATFEEQRLGVLDAQIAAETNPQRRAALEAQRRVAQRSYEQHTSPWRFATPALHFLRRLRALTDQSSHPLVRSWLLATYAGHFWSEFSADIYLGARSGPWPEEQVLDFFDRVNAAAEMTGDGFGRFAWRAIYNPQVVRDAVNDAFGHRRLLYETGHYDHIHLDVRPVAL